MGHVYQETGDLEAGIDGYIEIRDPETDERQPLVVERVAVLAKSIFPGSGDPALQVIDTPLDPIYGGDVRPEAQSRPPPRSTPRCFREEGRVAELEDVFDGWDR